MSKAPATSRLPIILLLQLGYHWQLKTPVMTTKVVQVVLDLSAYGYVRFLHHLGKGSSERFQMHNLQHVSILNNYDTGRIDRLMRYSSYMSYNKAFTPEGCSDDTHYPAMSVGVNTPNHSQLN